MAPIWNVFQKGLIRGSEHLSFDPEKAYAYVEHPIDGWRVYLRACVFLHARNKPHSARNFLVVKRRGTRYTTAAWEPPKGQMEGRDLKKDGLLLNILTDVAIREVFEEAHISGISQLTHTGLIFQSQETSYPRNHYFQYHIYNGYLTNDQIKQSFDKFEWIKKHPKGFARWSRDRKEKDAVDWFMPRITRLNPRWTPSIVALYYKYMKM
jgi:8-oxo-dGTP pyrophosphatase MutT (NUDIX family)